MKINKFISFIAYGLLAICMMNGIAITAVGLWYAVCTGYTLTMKSIVYKINPTTRL
jgi:hypothetical protein